MKTKNRLTLTVLFVMLFAASGLQAQANDECLQNLSIFAEYAKVKNYTAAYEPWSKVRKDLSLIHI